MNIKQQLLDFCVNYLKEKENTLLFSIRIANESADASTKSSVGDKHETSRAMAQLELEKLSGQYQEIIKQKSLLQNARIDHSSDKIIPGSLVKTSLGNYFISISAGKTVINGIDYFCISPASPLAQSLIHSDNKPFQINNKHYSILSIE